MKPKMPKLPLYSTEISCLKSASEIEDYLSLFGKVNINKNREGDIINDLHFTIELDRGIFTFRVPVYINEVYQILIENKKRIRDKNKLREQAAKVAWRMARNWVIMQITQARLSQKIFFQMFLPFIVDENNKTMFEIYEENKLKCLTDGKGGAM